MEAHLRIAYDPHIYFSTLAWSKIKIIVDIATQEVGWLCSVSEVEDMPFIYIIKDLHLFEQTVHGAETELDDKDILQWFDNQIKEDKLDFVNGIKMWGHSHVNMSPSPSGQDVSQIEALSEHSEFFIMGIFNKKGDVRLDLYTPTMILKDMTHSVIYPEDTAELRKQLKEEFDDKVTAAIFGYTGNNYGYKHNRSRAPSKRIQPIFNKDKGGLNRLRSDGQQDIDFSDKDWPDIDPFMGSGFS